MVCEAEVLRDGRFLSEEGMVQQVSHLRLCPDKSQVEDRAVKVSQGPPGRWRMGNERPFYIRLL
jgi:hypothetical protein